MHVELMCQLEGVFNDAGDAAAGRFCWDTSDDSLHVGLSGCSRGLGAP